MSFTLLDGDFKHDNFFIIWTMYAPDRPFENKQQCVNIWHEAIELSLTMHNKLECVFEAKPETIPTPVMMPTPAVAPTPAVTSTPVQSEKQLSIPIPSAVMPTSVMTSTPVITPTPAVTSTFVKTPTSAVMLIMLL
jgi:hypothetical protein